MKNFCDDKIVEKRRNDCFYCGGMCQSTIFCRISSLNPQGNIFCRMHDWISINPLILCISYISECWEPHFHETSLLGTKNRWVSSLDEEFIIVVIRDKKWLNVAIKVKILLGVVIKVKNFWINLERLSLECAVPQKSDLISLNRWILREFDISFKNASGTWSVFPSESVQNQRFLER